MVIIVGAGLSGLLIGYHLKKEGIPFKILEARSRAGGRINTVYNASNAPVEMGATWFTYQHTHLISLLKELNIVQFDQSMDSTVFYESGPNAKVQLVKIPSQASSHRIAGGSSNLINTLLKALNANDILYNESVKQIKISDNSVEVITNQTFKGNKVVMAIPPKLWSKKITFSPNLPSDVMTVATQTQTWMEDSIKIALTYDHQFWGQNNIPGTLFSNAGPIIELYDHSNSVNSKHALCGFINSSLKQLTYEERRERVINQLKSVFGNKAESFTSYNECVWRDEKETFIEDDTFLNPHQNNGHPSYVPSIFDDKLLISSPESAPQFAGDMEGAVQSALIIAQKIIKAQH
jgi:monoamine oxidase